MANPYLTSNAIIESVKRKISFPTSQQTFDEDDILAFCNEEMFIGQVPSVLLYHEEFFVTSKDVPLITNKIRYPIPDRAIGMKLRDLFWKDTNGNLFEMVRINPEDKALFQRNFNNGIQLNSYYLEGNDIVLANNNLPNPTGNLNFSFFLRPNQLVTDDNAATITGFSKQLQIVNASLSNGDTLIFSTPNNSTVIITATTGIPAANEFAIGGTSIITATNLVNTLNTNGIVFATNSATDTVVMNYSDVNLSMTTNNILGIVIDSKLYIQFNLIPTNITNNSIIDFLQTKPGHRILNYDVEIDDFAVSGTTISFDPSIVPTTLIVGDYICLANTAIIPYIPPDLHNVLAERTSARILSSIGDLENLGAVQAKIKEMELSQGMLIDNRLEGRPQKIVNRHGLLRAGKSNLIRRF